VCRQECQVIQSYICLLCILGLESMPGLNPNESADFPEVLCGFCQSLLVITVLVFRYKH
jgi:hypothetical protein